MKMKVTVLVLILLVSAAPSSAADVDGKWSGSVDTPNGHANVEFTFKADGGALMGTASGPNAKEVSIKNGKIAEDKISFSVEFDFGTVDYTGVVSPGQIKLTADVMGMPVEFVVKKSQ